MGNKKLGIGLVGLLFSIFLAGVIRKTLLKEVINQFYATDTSSWPLAADILWQLFPIFIISIPIFLSFILLMSYIE